jgi:catechol 2,3-dioxygenase-like lactoylglutathione lyase family enzyme
MLRKSRSFKGGYLFYFVSLCKKSKRVFAVCAAASRTKNVLVLLQTPSMLTDIHPKLPMRDKNTTKDFYVNKLGFKLSGTQDYEGYLMLEKDDIGIHFFEYKDLVPEENYGQVYIRVSEIDAFYQSLLDNKVAIHPNGELQSKPWGQKEFALLDPDYNLLTFGQAES